MQNLTPKQKQIFEFIKKYYHQNGYSPSLKELAKHFKKSTATIHQYIAYLQKKGFISTPAKGTARGLIPVETIVNSPSPLSFRIGIIGYGIVGQAVAYGFSRQEIHIYDKFKPSESIDTVVANSDYIFICLPTPFKKDKQEIDLSIINQSLREITQLTDNTDKIIIIKSTVIPGTTLNYVQKYPKSLFCFNPEFLTERSFLQDFIKTDRIIIGTSNDLVFRKISAIYQSIMPNTPIFQTDPTTAEMVKYMANAFLATKVIFANEMYDLCQIIGISYEEVKRMVVADHRIGGSHLEVTTLRGFGGKCFPKDLIALMGLCRKLKVDFSLLEQVWRKNLQIRKIRDWEDIPFAVSDPSFGNKS